MANTLQNNRNSLRIKKPHITEKASMLSAMAGPAYVFQVEPELNKIELKKIITEIYKVTPVKINIVNLPSKKVFIRGKRGIKSGMKKAIVYLKKGEKMNLV